MTYEEMEKSLQELRDTMMLHERASRERMDRMDKSFHERMDRFDNSLQELRDTMSRHERMSHERMDRLENSLQELRDTQLVHVRLLDRNEREWKDGMVVLQAAMAKLFERMDRFFEGRDREDGHK